MSFVIFVLYCEKDFHREKLRLRKRNTRDTGRQIKKKKKPEPVISTSRRTVTSIPEISARGLLIL